MLEVTTRAMKTTLARLSQLSNRLAVHRHFPILGGCGAFLLYLFIAWFILQPEAVWSPDEGAKLLQLKSLRVENASLNINIVYTSQGMDPEFQYALINPSKDLLTVQNGALMLPRLPVFTLFTLPFYTCFGMWGLYWLPALGGGLATWLTLSLIHTTERRLYMWSLIVLGSPILIYAVIFWEHTLAAALGLAAACLIVAGSEHPIAAPFGSRWILAAGLLAIATYLRLEIALFALALLVAAFIIQPEIRAGLLLTLGIYSILMLPYPLLHQILFEEQALPLNARHLNLPLAYLGQTGWTAVQDLLIGPYTDEAINPGWIGAFWAGTATIALILSWITLVKPELRNWLNATLAISLLPAAYFLFTPVPYRAAHGLLFTTPWALLGLSRIPELWSQKNAPLRTISLTVLLGLSGYTLVMLFFRASSPHGGLEWGARFALVFYPLLALLVGCCKVKSKSERFLLGLFIILGIGFQLRGLVIIHHDKLTNQALNQALLAAPEVQVLSDLWWLPLDAAPIYPNKAFFLAADPESMAGWINQAGEMGFRNVLLVTLDPDLPKKVYSSSNFALTVIGEDTIENLHNFHLLLKPR